METSCIILTSEVKVGVERFYGKGRHAWSSEAEKMVEEERIKQDIYFKGEKSIYQIYETENEARNATLSWAVGLILPNYIKGATGAANASKSAVAAKTGLTFNKGVKEAFIKHFNSGGRHADLGLSVETMASKGMNLVESNMHLLKAGDNTLIGNINGIQKSFKTFVKDGKIMSVNMYPGVSNRVTQGTTINFGNVSW